MAWLVVAVLAVLAVALVPVPVAVWSTGFTETKPETDKALAAFGAALAEKVTVIVSLTAKAMLMEAEKISVLIVVPLAMLRSCA